MKKIFTTLLLTATLMGAMAQKANDPVVFEINGKNVYKSEFMKDFLHSIGKDPSAEPTACTYEKRKALEDYVQLYVNFKTKMTDAYAMGFDTLPRCRCCYARRMTATTMRYTLPTYWCTAMSRQRPPTP